MARQERACVADAVVLSCTVEDYFDCEIDLRACGVFRTTMQSPEGKPFPNAGFYLEIIADKKLVWTNALLPGFRPSAPSATCGDENVDFKFSAMIELADDWDRDGNGTRYIATVIHADEAGCKQRASMGFEGGWGLALDQMIATSYFVHHLDGRVRRHFPQPRLPH